MRVGRCERSGGSAVPRPVTSAITEAAQGCQASGKITDELERRGTSRRRKGTDVSTPRHMTFDTSGLCRRQETRRHVARLPFANMTPVLCSGVNTMSVSVDRVCLFMCIATTNTRACCREKRQQETTRRSNGR